MTANSWYKLGLAVAAVTVFAGVAAQAVTITPLSTVTPGNATTVSGIVVNAISPDATVVVGQATFDGAAVKTPALINVATNTIYNLGDPNWSTTTASNAVGVGIKSNGEVWVLVNATNLLGYSQAYLWAGDASGSGAYTDDVILPTDSNGNPTGNNSTGTSLAVQTTDEVMVCGTWAVTPPSTTVKGFRYRTMPSFLDIDKPPSSNYNNNANGISAFGDIGGYSANCQVGGGNHRNAWTWTSSNYTWICTLVGTINNNTESTAAGVPCMSLDGLHVVGRSMIAIGSSSWHAYMSIPSLNANGWANSIDLGVLEGRPNPHTYSEATAVNGYGTVAAGYSQALIAPTDKRYVIWDATNGMRDLLAVAGDPPEWTAIANVKALSQDGATLIGHGTYNGTASTPFIMKQIYDPPLPAPAPDIDTVPNDDAWVAGRPYVKDVTLLAGRLPLPSWSASGAPGLTAVSYGKGGRVSGWTPGAGDIGSVFNLSATATSSSGSDTESWTVTVVAPAAPVVSGPLVAGNTSVTVSSIYTYATQVDLYLNGGSTPIATATAPPESFSSGSYTFTGLAPLVNGDCYTAKQTVGTVESPLSDAVCVGAPAAPLVNPVLLAGGTSVTVSSVYTFSTAVSLYVNGGTTPVASQNPNGATTVTFTLPSGMIVDDYYTATQTAGGVESVQSGKRYVLPTALGLFEDFETDPMNPQWIVNYNGLPLTTLQAHSPTHSVLQTINPVNGNGGQLLRDVTPADPYPPGSPYGQYDRPILVECWLYESFTPPVTQGANQRFGFDQWSGGARNWGNLQYSLEIGVGTGIRSPETNYSIPADATTYDPNYYNGNLLIQNPGSRNCRFLLNDPLCPLRTPGWHKLSIKIGDNKSWWYVDGRRGKQKQNVSPSNLNHLWIGSWSGSPDGNDSYYDDVKAVIFEEHTPVVTVPPSPVVAGLNQPFTMNVTVSDVDTPDTFRLSMVGTLPAGLSLSEALPKDYPASATAGPSVTLTISGTPTVLGDTTLTFNATDDTGHTGTASVTISVQELCAPPTVSAISPNVGVQDRSNVRPHPPYDGVSVPSAPVHATITGDGFTAGATVKLQKSGLPDIVGTNVVVVSATQITCDLDLSGAAPGALDGAWDVVVTTCNTGRLVGGFTISMCFTPRQDADGDGDVDLSDFSVFQNCFNGPNRPYKLPAGFNKDCYCFDSGDNPIVNDVDLSDFNSFQGCFNGPNRPPKAGC